MQNFFLNSKWNCKIENHCFNVKLLPWAHFLNLFYLTVLTKNLQILICIWLYLEFDAPYLPYHFNCSRLLILYIVAHEESLFSFYRNEYFWEVNYIYCVRSPCVKLFNPFVNRCCIYKHDFIIIICGQLDFESSFYCECLIGCKSYIYYNLFFFYWSSVCFQHHSEKRFLISCMTFDYKKRVDPEFCC